MPINLAVADPLSEAILREMLKSGLRPFPKLAINVIHKVRQTS